jgi:hydroxymethylbilane synthase
VSELRLATRRSPLALIQARLVADDLSARGHSCTLVELETEGDLSRDRPLREIAGEGVFAVAVQQAVLSGRADVAVHSAKDLPSRTPDGLVIGAVSAREDPADALVGRAPGARVATGSPRRRAMLLHERPDLDVVELRGNMARRVGTVGTNGVDAVVVAIAALARLGWLDHVAERLDPERFVPQVGQGALALEARADDTETRAALADVTDPAAERAVTCERAFLAELGSGCSVPAAAYATASDGLRVRAMMASMDGSVVLRAVMEGDDASSLGRDVARHLRDEAGGRDLDGWGPS